MRLLFLYIVLPVTLFTGNFFCSAQTTVYNTSNSGLPDNRVNKVLVDASQRIWCATEYGVACLDGNTWTVYNSTNSGLTDNYTRSLTMDGYGRLWVGTLSSGIFMFDGGTWQQVYSGNSGLNDDCIKDVQFDTAGHWWVATTGGLNYYDSTSWNAWNVFNSNLLTNNISFVRFKGAEKHFGTINGGLNIMNAANTSITSYTTFNSGLHDNTLPDGEFDTTGALWLATPAAGLMIHYNGNTWQWLYTGTSNIVTNSLNSICSYGSKWYMTSLDTGLIIYNGSSFSAWNTSNTQLPENYLLDVAHDSSDNIWLGSYSSGLIKIKESTLSVSEPETNPWQLVQNITTGNELRLINARGTEKYTIYQADGKQVRLGNVNGDGQISLWNLTPGLYYLQVTNGLYTGIFRFVQY